MKRLAVVSDLEVEAHSRSLESRKWRCLYYY